MSEDSVPLVTIRCITYNHEPYIAQCLDGFVKQKTNFKFEAIVHDDASTDNTASIIKEYAEKYPDIIKPIFETENQYSKHDGSLRRIMNEHVRGKYVAFCEGDDYWTDPDKLQKQVDFLEINPSFGLTYSNYLTLVNNKLVRCKCHPLPDNAFDKLLVSNDIATLTVCMRSSLLKDYNSFIKSNANQWGMGDYPLWLFVSANTKIFYQSDYNSVYRVINGSASHSNVKDDDVKFILDEFSIASFFINQYCDTNSHKYRAILQKRCHLMIKSASLYCLPELFIKAKSLLESLGSNISVVDYLYYLLLIFNK